MIDIRKGTRKIDMGPSPIVYRSQEEMRFGPRSYTLDQARVIENAVKVRKPLPAPALPIDDAPMGSS